MLVEKSSIFPGYSMRNNVFLTGVCSSRSSKDRIPTFKKFFLTWDRMKYSRNRKISPKMVWEILKY